MTEAGTIVSADPPRRFPGLLLPLGALGLWLMLVAAAEMLAESSHFLTTCLFRNIVGLPCPTCGSTRAVRALVAGHPLEAVLWNPMVVLGGASVAAWVLFARSWEQRVRPPLSARARAWLWAAGALVFLTNWVYVIVTQRGT